MALYPLSVVHNCSNKTSAHNFRQRQMSLPAFRSRKIECAHKKAWSSGYYGKIFRLYELISALRADINSIRGLRPLIIPRSRWPSANIHGQCGLYGGGGLYGWGGLYDRGRTFWSGVTIIGRAAIILGVAFIVRSSIYVQGLHFWSGRLLWSGVAFMVRAVLWSGWPLWLGADVMVGGGLYGRGQPLWSWAAFMVGLAFTFRASLYGQERPLG